MVSIFDDIQIVKSCIKYLEQNHPYSKDIFPTEISRVKDFIPNNKQRTAISGCIARVGYDAAIETLKDLIKGQE